MYRIVVHSPFVSKLSEVSSELVASSTKEWLIYELADGIVVTLLILSSTVILMSFVDFLRFQQVAGADGQDFVVVLPPPPPEAPQGIHHPRDAPQTAGAALHDRPERRWRLVHDGGNVEKEGFHNVLEANHEPVGGYRRSSKNDENDHNAKHDPVAEPLSPWQFPDDWNFDELEDFHDADAFYAWLHRKESSSGSAAAMGEEEEEKEEEGEEEESDDEEERLELLFGGNPNVEEDLAFIDLPPGDDLADDDLPENPRGEVDLREVLLDVLGLRGQLKIMVRNVVWLLMFNAIYLGVFASIPFNLGSFYSSFFRSFRISPAQVESYEKWLVSPQGSGWKAMKEFVEASLAQDEGWLALYAKVTEACKRLNLAMDPLIVGKIFVGYALLLSSIFTLDWIMGFLTHRTNTHRRAAETSTTASILRSVDHCVGVLSCVAKVGCLLSLRIFFTPTLLGSFILFSYNHLAKYPADAWIELYCSNVVGGIMVTWALGICNMLTVTLTVLQLREVLHPDILAKFIRPQEPHLELLSSLMHESGYTHVRRLAVSLTVYLSVLVVLMHIPVLLLQEARSGIPHELWQVRYWYVVPQIQLPLETSISLGIFLSLLEKKKNVIGKLLHVWFKHASNYLGLTRYCMPLNFEVLDLDRSHPDYHRYEGHKMCIVDRAPLVRPPDRWDSKSFERSGRWAWSEERPGEVERRVCPRVTKPTYRTLRVFLLLTATWSIVTFAVCLAVPLPVLYGRMVFRSIALPQWLRHDLLAQFLGVCEVVSYGTKSWRGLGRWLREIRHPCNGSAFLRGRIRSFVDHVVTFTVVGGHVRIWHVSSVSDLFPPAPFSWITLLECFVAGKFIVGALTWFSESFIRDNILAWLVKGREEKYVHGMPWFGRLTQTDIGSKIFHDRLHNAVVYFVAVPVLGYGCLLTALHAAGFAYASLPSVFLNFADGEGFEALFLKLARYHVLFFWEYLLAGVLAEVFLALLRDLHDTAYNERYRVGRVLENRADAKAAQEARAATEASTETAAEHTVAAAAG